MPYVDSRRTLAERYELIEVVGRGGMGTVYRATDRRLERTVAVKVLPAEFAEADPVSVARFEREARAAAALAAPGIVAVYDTGVDQGARFIVMEYVAGRSVERILREQGRLAPERAVDVAIQVADALGAAHALGIVHRDIKPANVMIADEGPVKVLDFGIARALDGTALTHSASVLGTAAYMSPEQVLGRPADARSDLYALGCLLYAMLAGRPPFTGETVAAILHQQVNDEPRSLHAFDRRIPAPLAGLVQRMLAKAPEDRPQSAARVSERLAAARAGRLIEPIGSSEPTVVLPRSARGRRRGLAVLAAIAGLVLLGIAIAALSGGGSPHTAAGGTQHSRTRSKAATHKTHASSTATAPATSKKAASPPTTAKAPSTTAPTTPAQPTVAGSAGALTTLLTTDVEQHTIEPPVAQQIGNEVSAILNNYDMGHLMNLPHEISNLDQQVAMLESKGQISAAAAPALHVALVNLDAALAKVAPDTETQTGQPPAQPPAPGNG